MSLLLQPPGVLKVSGPYAVRLCERIEEVSAAEWDSILGPDDLQATHGFIKTCQESGIENASFRHLMVYEDERLVCVASLTFIHVSLDLLSSGMTRRLIRLMRSVRPDFLRVPVLMCGLPVSFGNSCIRFSEGADSARIVEVVTGLMDSVAQETGASLLCFKEFTAEEAARLKYLTQTGYFRAHSLPGCSLRIEWASFEDYLASMRAGYRRQLMATLRVRQEAALTVRVLENFREACAPVHWLYEEVMKRAEFQLEQLNLQFFEALNTNLGARSRALLLEREGRLLAAAIMLSTERAATLLLVGMDYEQNRAYHSYFNIVIEAVREAIRAGVEVLELGQTSYDLKGRLGGATSERYIYLKHRKRWLNSIYSNASPFLFPSAKAPARRVFKMADDK